MLGYKTLSVKILGKNNNSDTLYNLDFWWLFFGVKNA